MKIIIIRYDPRNQWGVTFLEDCGYAISLISIYLGSRKIFIGTKFRKGGI